MFEQRRQHVLHGSYLGLGASVPGAPGTDALKLQLRLQVHQL